MPNTSPHIIRVVGSYSLLTFFTAKAQNAFLDKSTDPELEAQLGFGGQYARGTRSFSCDTDERDFELKMANYGFIREAFWKNSFPPIFKLNDVETLMENCWKLLSNTPIQDQIRGIINKPENDQFCEALLYRYGIYKLNRELKEICEDHENLKIHIGLNKFGLINVGMTIEVERRKFEKFKNLCKRVYEKVAHLQEDPLKNLEVDIGAGPTNEMNNFLNELYGCRSCRQTAWHQMTTEFQANPNGHLSNWESRNCTPRLLVSYFQVLAVTLIYLFLFEKLCQVSQDYRNRDFLDDFFELRGWQRKVWCLTKKGGWKPDWNNLTDLLDNPWSIANRLRNSNWQNLPPLRHVVFMYELVHRFYRKQCFLSRNANKRALLTLGHNVGWSPSSNPPFPPFEGTSNQALPADSSLLKNSCCLIFPQGLVVVTPPNNTINTINTMYLGGVDKAYFESNPHYSPSSVPYEDYWRLIFKLLIRVVETRLLLGMINRYLSDCHKDFIDHCKKGRLSRMIWYFGRIFGRKDPIYGKLIRIGWLFQRISENVVTPEVSRFSFVRKKIISFMEGANFQEHREHIQLEFEKLNNWLDAERITTATRTAIYVAIIGVLITAWGTINNQDKSLQAASGAVKTDLAASQDNLAVITENLESLKRKLQLFLEENSPQSGNSAGNKGRTKESASYSPIESESTQQ